MMSDEGISATGADGVNLFRRFFIGLSRLLHSPSIPADRRPHATGLLSHIFFVWAIPTVWAATTRGLQIADFELIDPQRKVGIKVEQFQLAFQELLKAKSHFPLPRAIFTCYRRDAILSFGLTLLYFHILLFHCLLFQLFGKYLQDAYERQTPAALTRGVLLAFAIAIVLEVALICRTHAFYHSKLMGGEVRTLVATLMYAKAFRMGPTAMRPAKTKTGKGLSMEENTPAEKDAFASGANSLTESYWTKGTVLNSMSVDTERIEMAIAALPDILPLIPSFPAIVGMAYWLLDWPGVVGVASLILCTPLTIMFGYEIGKRRQAINKLSEKRANLVIDMLNGVRFLKIFAWEQVFLDRINIVRKEESRRLQGIQRGSLLVWLGSLMLQSAPSLLAVGLFSRYFDITKSYTVITSQNLLALVGLAAVEQTFYTPTIVLAIQSIGNVQRYLSAEEHCTSRMTDAFKINPAATSAIEMDKAEFSWHSQAAKEVSRGLKQEPGVSLAPITLRIARGELIALVGAVGSGKSSIACALVGEMVHLGGTVTFGYEKVAYCTQDPWIQHASIRENITFGLPYDKEKYSRILAACAITHDVGFEFPEGDMAELGERGSTISGGQKARIQLARTLYREPRVVILDDPLSAVDAPTARHIFDHAIVRELEGCCRILITHQLELLSECSRVAWVHEGSIRAVGPYDDLLRSDPEFVQFVDSCTQDTIDREEVLNPPSGVRIQQSDDSVATKQVDTLVKEEERAINSVPFSLHAAYTKLSMPWLIFLSLVCMLAVSQAINMILGLTIAWWTQHQWDLPDWAYAAMFLANMAVNILTVGVLYVIIHNAYINGSYKLTKQTIDAVFRAPLSFFDTTPVGRIMNRFTLVSSKHPLQILARPQAITQLFLLQDVNYTDTILPHTYWRVGLCSFLLLAIIVTIIFYVHISAIIFVPWFFAIICILRLYRATPLELRRIEVKRMSLFVAKLAEGMSGHRTIVGCDRQDHFQAKLYNIIDELNSIHFTSFSTHAWMTTWTAVFSTVLTWLVGIFITQLRYDLVPSVGLLLLTTCPTLSSISQELLDQTMQLQQGMNAVERLNYYRTSIPEEGPRRIKNSTHKSWPQHGGIEIQDAYMRYRSGLPLSLQGLNLSINPGEKVGIVGRTGAGKSSLLSILLRTVNLELGSIRIDGIDTAHISLHDLRRRLAVIPQDPTLFLGTLRYNLDPNADPTDNANDARLENALRAMTLFHDGPGTSRNLILDSPVESEGTNFSHGDRQLGALARALVRNSRIIIIDEATSSVDPRTDTRIQRTISTEFKDKTVLAIAHRIKTVVHYDKVVVMERGRIVEFGKPRELWAREGKHSQKSMFRGLCDAANITEDSFCHRPGHDAK